MQNKIKKNMVIQMDNEMVVRILEVKESQCLVIDCQKKTMPYWMDKEVLAEGQPCEFELEAKELDENSKKVMHQRFTMIAAILSVIGDNSKRNVAIQTAASEYEVSKQTVRKCLCDYLVYQNIEILAPQKKAIKHDLTRDQKNMRWALNKFFYTTDKNTLKTAYTMMLKHKYCDNGKLKDEYPKFHQFKYFYNKTKNLQNYYISRDGLSDYQRNHRPLTGDGVQQFASCVGTAMLDATVCDIYLVNDFGEIVGRPVLTACVDAFSGLCLGYSLGWEGGTYSLRNLMLNVVTDKVEHCKRFGIDIEKDDWNASWCPAKLITDMGSEYASDTFAQLTDLGVSIFNLQPFRPDNKGQVEKFFDLIQNLYKPHLKRAGTIELDFQERGVQDYRKNACLTLDDFEKIILHCILFYNSKRIVENYPFTDAMLSAKVQPYANAIWNYGLEQPEANLIEVSKEQMILTLLPRTEGKFSRFGLKVNGMRYHHQNYNEKYLRGESVTVAYNPESSDCVWLIENGKYICFDLIESRFGGKSLEQVNDIKGQQKALVKDAKEERIQAEIDLANHIQVIAESRGQKSTNKSIKNIRQNREKEKARTHIDLTTVIGQEHKGVM